jgi:anti-sigma factor RsiW
MKPGLDDDACPHPAAAWLPWYLNDTLDEPRRREVDEHLAQCPACRADARALAPLRELRHAPEPVVHTPQAGFSRLLARIDEAGDAADAADAAAAATPAAEPAALPPRRRAWSAPVRWLAAAVLVQALALGITAGALLGRGEPAAPYRTLSSPPAAAPATPALRVLFVPTLSLAEWQALLQREQLVLLAGPGESGLFTLGLGSAARGTDELPQVLARLRADPRVRFAEPLGPEPAPR